MGPSDKIAARFVGGPHDGRTLFVDNLPYLQFTDFEASDCDSIRDGYYEMTGTFKLIKYQRLQFQRYDGRVECEYHFVEERDDSVNDDRRFRKGPMETRHG